MLLKMCKTRDCAHWCQTSTRTLVKVSTTLNNQLAERKKAIILLLAKVFEKLLKLQNIRVNNCVKMK